MIIFFTSFFFVLARNQSIVFTTLFQAQRKEQVTRSVIVCDYLKRARVSLPYALIVFSPSYLPVGIRYTSLRHSEREESPAMLMAFQSSSSDSRSVIPIFPRLRHLNKVITPLHEAL